MKNSAGNILIIAGLFFLIITAYLYWQKVNPWKLSFSKIPKSQNVTATTRVKPISISLPDLNIDLPIIEAEIKNNSWPTTDKGVSYLITSTEPGQVGNSIFYGHNWENILGRLSKVKPGQNIIVNLENGKNLTFKIDTVSIVSPNQTNVLDESADKRITVYTCTGFLDTKRLVAVAKLVE